ncbi:MAG: hypothetical protein KC425_00425 [Anaerolineales bacterium]|nr:hypothetical protein [Anaerolineales bacterium]
MSTLSYHTPNHQQRAFARTNAQTIRQRVALMRELLPPPQAIAEICCGDCRRQRDAYTAAFPHIRYTGLDIDAQVVAANRARGITCAQGDALDPAALAPLLPVDLLFFGPPLSVSCDGHTPLAFRQVTPGYLPFAQLLFGQLQFAGTLVCICPNTTTLGDARWLYTHIRQLRPDAGLRLIHHSYATRTGNDEPTPLRHKYVELWFSPILNDAWELRISEA